MAKLLKDFRDFAMRGNVVDMAVGVVIGGAFGQIITSLVDGVIMPVVGVLTGGTDFSEFKYVLKPEVLDGVTQEVITPEVAITWGALIQTIVNFIIIAFCIFIVIRFMQNMRRKKEMEEAPAAPAGPSQEELLTEIRDILAKQQEKK